MSIFFKLIIFNSIILLSLCSTSVLAKSFRCNSKVVMVGYSTFEVKDKCGQPKDEEDIGYVKVGDEYVNVKRYIYDFGRGKLLKILEFHNGKLFEINDGPRK